MALLLNANDTVSRSYSYTIPSPNHVSEVQAVGDRTGNLFDYKKYFESTFTIFSEYFEWAEIQLKPFTTYTFTTSFSESTVGTSINTAFIIATSTEEPKTLKGGISSTRICTKTTEQDGIIKIYKRIRGKNLPKKEDFDSGMHWLMINEGDTALSYEPYGYKIPVVTSADGTEPITTPIYLDSPLYKIGNYADRLSKTEEVRVVNELVLTGEENFSYDDTYTRFTLKIPNARATSNRSDETPCTHYISIHDGRSIYDVPDDSIYVTVGGGYVYINIKDITYTSLADFKSYLAAQYAAGTPVKVYYVLATPETKTVEPVEIPTLNGTTVIDVDTAVKPTEMYTKYKSSK